MQCSCVNSLFDIPVTYTQFDLLAQSLSFSVGLLPLTLLLYNLSIFCLPYTHVRTTSHQPPFTPSPPDVPMLSCGGSPATTPDTARPCCPTLCQILRALWQPPCSWAPMMPALQVHLRPCRCRSTSSVWRPSLPIFRSVVMEMAFQHYCVKLKEKKGRITIRYILFTFQRKRLMK